jgi:hypothetical protein
MTQGAHLVGSIRMSSARRCSITHPPLSLAGKRLHHFKTAFS